MMDRYDVAQVAIKIPDVFPGSVGYNQLIGAFNLCCKSKNIAPHYYQFSEIKAAYCADGKQNSAGLMESMVRKYPDLMPEYKKEQQNRNTHYHKLFEAVAAAHMKYSTKVA